MGGWPRLPRNGLRSLASTILKARLVPHAVVLKLATNHFRTDAKSVGQFLLKYEAFVIIHIGSRPLA